MASNTRPGGSRGHSISYQQREAERAAAERERQRAAQQDAINSARANAGPAKGIPWPGGSSAASGGVTPSAPEPAPSPRAPFQWNPDSIYNDTVGLNQRRYEQAIGSLDDTERKTKFEYGFEDPTNPFSRVGELKRGFLALGKSSQTSLNSRGMLYSGANLRSIARNKRNEDQANASLRQAYEAALESIRQQRLNAKTSQEQADLAARQASFDRQFAAYQNA